MTKLILQDPLILHKASALLSRVSLDQEIGQMILCERLSASPQEVKKYHLGGVMFAGDSLPGENLPADWVGMNDAYWAASMTEDEQRYLSWPGGSELLSAVGKKRCSPVFQRGYGMTYKSERLNQDSKSIGV